MKISIINASPRPRGATATILREIQAYLSEKYHADILYVDLGQVDMQFCRGCLACYRTGTCVITDDEVEELATQVKASDGIVIGSPTYGSNISGMLKNWMDRGHFIVEQSLRGKWGFSVVTCEIADGGEALKVLKKFFLVSGAGRRGEFLVKVPFNGEPLAKPEVRKRLHQQLDSFAAAINKQKPKSLYERIFNDWIVVQLIWKPIFVRQPDKYAGILRLWKEKQIV
jgi:multimeric flavodoxin WrbA